MTTSASTVTRLPIADETRAFLARPLGNIIDGEVRAAADGATLPVIDPGTGEQVSEAPDSGAADVDAAVASARAAYADGRWRSLPPFEKEARLRRLARLVESNQVLLMEVDMIDNGMPRVVAGYHTFLQAEVVNYYAGWPSKITGTVHPTPDDLVVTSRRKPIGVCVAIIPWNGPATSALWKIAPALACGNCVILKPAEQTPMSAVVLGQLCLEAGIPPGVVNVVQGVGGGAGAALVAHHGVDKISFTGSTVTGRGIAAAAAARVKHVTLELGGKGANLVFGDADLDAAAQGSLASIWANSGQTCIAGSRLLVQRAVHDEFVDRLVAMTRHVKVGNGFDPDTTMGPLVSQRQLDRVLGYLSLGKEEGASVAVGGERADGGGYFVRPTILTGVHNSMRIAREEIFGPVLSVIPFDTEDEAIAIANDTDYGLGAGLWTRDVARASRVGDALDAGTIWVNTYGELLSNVPFGGIKQSGLGKELGEGGIEAFTETRTTYLRRG
jgi:acyl-CoA reductase-like NAD-dependent aldehyde dehydrogenase